MIYVSHYPDRTDIFGLAFNLYNANTIINKTVKCNIDYFSAQI